MRWLSKMLVIIICFGCSPGVESVAVGQTTQKPTMNWPQFRGSGANGVSHGSPPIEWNVETGKNVRWKTKIDGLGHSSPIVWGDQVFLTTATSVENDQPGLSTGWMGGTGKAATDSGEWTWKVICVGLSDGKIQWERDVATREPTIKRHLKATHANCSMATNGKFVVAFFGSEGLFCFDMAGKAVWNKDLGRLHSGPYNAKELEWGFASSPIIFKENLIIQCDCLNTGFVAVLDLATGKQKLRIAREDVASWSTPAIVETASRTQIVCNGFKQMAGYDFTSGEQLWTLKGGGDVPVPTPLFANGLIYLTNGHGRTPTYAISPAASGDLTPAEDAEKLPDGLTWYQPRDGSYMPTPIVIGDRLYTCNDNGRLVVRNAMTGEQIYRRRVSGRASTYSASAVATPDRVYFSGENGDVVVIKTGDEYELLAENQMGEVVMATPAISGNRLLIRTSKALFCLENEK